MIEWEGLRLTNSGRSPNLKGDPEMPENEKEKTEIVRRAETLPFQSMSEFAEAGKLLAQAGFLGTKNAGEGFVVMATCRQTGMSLIEYQQKYHFRQGRFSMQAHAMLAEFVNRGGKYKLLERTPNRAAIGLSKDGQDYISSLTWEEALNEPFVYRGNPTEQMAELKKPLNQRRISDKYQTPRSRMQMLWARVISDGVVVMDPGSRMGVYTPEETDDFHGSPVIEHEIDPVEAAKKIKSLQQQVSDPEKELQPDYSRCPLAPWEGKLWADFPNDVLDRAVISDKLDQEYKDYIKRVIDIRKEKGIVVK